MSTRRQIPILWLSLLLVAFALIQLSAWAAEDIEYRFERMVPQLEQSGNFNHPGDIAAAADGSIWIADTVNQRLLHLSITGRVLGTISSQSQLSSIAIVADGSFWVADKFNHRLEHLSSSGVVLKVVGSLGSSLGQFDTPNDIAIAADGSVWAVDSDNNRVQHLNSSGEVLGAFGVRGAAPGQFNYPSGIAIAADDSLWVVDSYNHRLQHLSNTGAVIGTLGSEGKAAGQFYFPSRIAIATDGSLWVADTSNNRLQHFSSSGVVLEVVGSIGNALGYFRSPRDITAVTDGSVWVIDWGNNRLQHLSSSGAVLGVISNDDYPPKQFSGIADIAIAADSSVWVADNHRIQQLSSDGIVLGTFGNYGDPYRLIAVEADGSHWITDPNNNLQHLSSTGMVLGTFGSKGNGLTSMTVAADGSLWLSNRLHLVQHLSSSGALLGSWSDPYSYPGKVTVATDGTAWVTDGKFIRHLSSSASLLESHTFEESSPQDIAIAADGSFWVAILGSNEFGRYSVQHLSNTWESLGTYGRRGSAPGQFYFPSSIAIAADGSLWVADNTNNHLQKFSLHSKTTYKAIIVVGSGPSIGSRSNDIWEGSWDLANKAYKALLGQGFRVHEEIKLLTAGPASGSAYGLTNLPNDASEYDLDRNGYYDDLEVLTKTSLRQAITEWAKDAKKDVVLYIVSQGGPGILRLNNNEILSSSELNDWVNQLQSQTSAKINIILEASNSASFFDTLSAPNRYIFASAKANQAAVIANNGLNSFSYYFWSEIASGANVRNAFTVAQKAMSKIIVDQEVHEAQADTNGDRQADQQDLETLGDYYLGNGNTWAVAPPVIQAPSPASKTLNGETSTSFSINLTHTAELDYAWALVQRPDDLNIDSSRPLNFEKILLTCNYGKDQSQCQGSYNRFDVKGEYRLTFYAIDLNEKTSSPETLIITKTQGQSLPPVVYDDQQTTIYLRDVLVGGQHYQTALQYENNQFVLLPGTVKAAPTLFSPPAVFDDVSNQLTIPEAKAFGQSYQATLKHLGNYAFILENADPK